MTRPRPSPPIQNDQKKSNSTAPSSAIEGHFLGRAKKPLQLVESLSGNVRGLTFACTAPIIGWSPNSHLLPAAGEMVKEFHIGEARLLPSMIRSEKTFKPKSNNWSKVDQKAALSPGDDDRWWCQYMVGTAIGDAILLELSVSKVLSHEKWGKSPQKNPQKSTQTVYGGNGDR